MELGKVCRQLKLQIVYKPVYKLSTETYPQLKLILSVLHCTRSSANNIVFTYLLNSRTGIRKQTSGKTNEATKVVGTIHTTSPERVNGPNLVADNDEKQRMIVQYFSLSYNVLLLIEYLPMEVFFLQSDHLD